VQNIEPHESHVVLNRLLSNTSSMGIQSFLLGYKFSGERPYKEEFPLYIKNTRRNMLRGGHFFVVPRRFQDPSRNDKFRRVRILGCKPGK